MAMFSEMALVYKKCLVVIQTRCCQPTLLLYITFFFYRNGDVIKTNVKQIKCAVRARRVRRLLM